MANNTFVLNIWNSRYYQSYSLWVTETALTPKTWQRQYSSKFDISWL